MHLALQALLSSSFFVIRWTPEPDQELVAYHIRAQALTEDICSLRENVERLTFSVLWEVTPPEDDNSGVEVVSTHFTKVGSYCCAMTIANYIYGSDVRYNNDKDVENGLDADVAAAAGDDDGGENDDDCNGDNDDAGDCDDDDDDYDYEDVVVDYDDDDDNEDDDCDDHEHHVDVVVDVDDAVDDDDDDEEDDDSDDDDDTINEVDNTDDIDADHNDFFFLWW